LQTNTAVVFLDLAGADSETVGNNKKNIRHVKKANDMLMLFFMIGVFENDRRAKYLTNPCAAANLSRFFLYLKGKILN
jgi:hypothetical protein